MKKPTKKANSLKAKTARWPVFKPEHVKKMEQKYGKAQPELVELLHSLDKGKKRAA